MYFDLDDLVIFVFRIVVIVTSTTIAFYYFHCIENKHINRFSKLQLGKMLLIGLSLLSPVLLGAYKDYVEDLIRIKYSRSLSTNLDNLDILTVRIYYYVKAASTNMVLFMILSIISGETKNLRFLPKAKKDFYGIFDISSKLYALLSFLLPISIFFMGVKISTGKKGVFVIWENRYVILSEYINTDLLIMAVTIISVTISTLPFICEYKKNEGVFHINKKMNIITINPYEQEPAYNKKGVLKKTSSESTIINTNTLEEEETLHECLLSVRQKSDSEYEKSSDSSIKDLVENNYQHKLLFETKKPFKHATRDYLSKGTFRNSKRTEQIILWNIMMIFTVFLPMILRYIGTIYYGRNIPETLSISVSILNGIQGNLVLSNMLTYHLFTKRK
ncbi:hypothetical protein BB558_001891 [Smittium angustum]|uniref:Uncharacterized protein n=1 Tax=Smittium angustum TaxID=133377 RepID=A0A2U1JA35_SMIAN|nr:hypothetical protein BB558_001891 [Smittium angustum]